MQQEIDLLANYPRTKRDLGRRAADRTEQDRRVARQFGAEFFDGERCTGYGGFHYQPRFWQPVIPAFQQQYGLDSTSRVLDVGCAKGFMLYDFTQLIPGITVAGIDISQYAIDNAKEEVKQNLKVGCAQELPYEDNSFDLVISVTTVHNLDRAGCTKALQEIERVSRNNKFITVDAYRTAEEKKHMDMWNLTALTYMSADDWKAFFKEVGYNGDYYWFIP